MSLILEALKKSEQQRRLGEAPTLGSPALASRRRRSVLPLLAALILIAGGVGWWLLRTPAPPSANAPMAQTSPAGKPVSAPVATQTPTPTAPEHRSVANENIARSAAPTPANQLPIAKPDVASASDRGSVTPKRMTLPLGDRPGSVTQLPLAPPTPAGPRVAAEPSRKSVVAPVAPVAPVTSITPAAKPELPATSAAPAVAAAPPATAVAAPKKERAEPALPSVWELPYATRKDLPDLTLTMHVYSDDPQQRFVVIKGERHVEGDDVGGGLILREVRPDGIVLELKGQRFVYPRDGR